MARRCSTTSTRGAWAPSTSWRGRPRSIRAARDVVATAVNETAADRAFEVGCIPVAKVVGFLLICTVRGGWLRLSHRASSAARSARTRKTLRKDGEEEEARCFLQDGESCETRHELVAMRWALVTRILICTRSALHARATATRTPHNVSIQRSQWLQLQLTYPTNSPFSCRSRAGREPGRRRGDNRRKATMQAKKRPPLLGGIRIPFEPLAKNWAAFRLFDQERVTPEPRLACARKSSSFLSSSSSRRRGSSAPEAGSQHLVRVRDGDECARRV